MSSGSTLASCTTCRAASPWAQGRRLQSLSPGESYSKAGVWGQGPKSLHDSNIPLPSDLWGRSGHGAPRIPTDTRCGGTILGPGQPCLQVTRCCHICRTEIFSGKSVAHEDIKYEQACILYNLGEPPGLP